VPVVETTRRTGVLRVGRIGRLSEVEGGGGIEIEIYVHATTQRLNFGIPHGDGMDAF